MLVVMADAPYDPQLGNCRSSGWVVLVQVDAVVPEQVRVWAESAGAERIVVAAVAVGLLELLEHTVWQHWPETGSDGVAEAVGWVGYCEGRDGGVVEQKEVGRKDWEVVRGT